MAPGQHPIIACDVQSPQVRRLDQVFIDRPQAPRSARTKGQGRSCMAELVLDRRGLIRGALSVASTSGLAACLPVPRYKYPYRLTTTFDFGGESIPVMSGGVVERWQIPRGWLPTEGIAEIHLRAGAAGIAEVGIGQFLLVGLTGYWPPSRSGQRRLRQDPWDPAVAALRQLGLRDAFGSDNINRGLAEMTRRAAEVSVTLLPAEMPVVLSVSGRRDLGSMEILDLTVPTIAFGKPLRLVSSRLELRSLPNTVAAADSVKELFPWLREKPPGTLERNNGGTNPRSLLKTTFYVEP